VAGPLTGPDSIIIIKILDSLNIPSIFRGNTIYRHFKVSKPILRRVIESVSNKMRGKRKLRGLNYKI